MNALGWLGVAVLVLPVALYVGGINGATALGVAAVFAALILTVATKEEES